MKEFTVNVEGTITLFAPNELTAEERAMELIHGDLSALAETNVDLDFYVLNVKEV